jgi:hypothetical protein
MDPAAASFELVVPADPAFLETARLFAGAVARELGVHEDLVDDAKLGVSEACVVAGGAGAALRIRVELAGAGVRFRVDREASATNSPTRNGGSPLGEPAEPDLAEALLRGLFPDVRLDGNDDGRTISFVVPVGGPSDPD